VATDTGVPGHSSAGQRCDVAYAAGGFVGVDRADPRQKAVLVLTGERGELEADLVQPGRLDPALDHA